MTLKHPKTIAICGSMQAVDQMMECADALGKMGIACFVPSLDEPVDYADLPGAERAATKSRLIRTHVDKIKASDAVLICNVTLKDRENYIGANSFLEMGFAFAFEKTIYLLNDVPDQPNSDEIVGMLPISLKGDLERLFD